MKIALHVIISVIIIILIVIISLSLTLLNENKDLETKNNPITELGNQTKKNNGAERYPWHENVWATEFWIGESPDSYTDVLWEAHSAWDEKWVEHYGGFDDPKNRENCYPIGFTPKENPFYCALPYGDFDHVGIKSNLNVIYWYQPGDEKDDNHSILKNRWIKVKFNEKTCYCQWEDTGPNYSDDWQYVFGTARPKNEVGGTESKSALDLSPAMRTCLGMDGHDQMAWQFVDAENVPNGPWKEIVTDSDPCWIYPESSCQ